MSQSGTSLREIRALVLSFHSLLVFETVEEERLGVLLAAVAADRFRQRFLSRTIFARLKSSSTPYAEQQSKGLVKRPEIWALIFGLVDVEVIEMTTLLPAGPD